MPENHPTTMVQCKVMSSFLYLFILCRELEKKILEPKLHQIFIFHFLIINTIIIDIFLQRIGHSLAGEALRRNMWSS